MAKYSLWITDDHMNRFCVPLSRNGQTCKEKVDLYEIDLLTVSLGKEFFIEYLKKSNIAPNDFNWENVTGYIQYQMRQKQCYLPLLFVKDKLLVQFLNFQNEYRYQQGLTETQLLYIFRTRSTTEGIKQILFSLTMYRDYMLDKMKQFPSMFKNENLSKKLVQKIHSYVQSIDYDEQMEYKNEILMEMLSYITFRRLKSVEYDCHINQPFANLATIQEESYDKREIDPDEIAFLTEEELDMYYGVHYEK